MIDKESSRQGDRYRWEEKEGKNGYVSVCVCLLIRCLFILPTRQFYKPDSHDINNTFINSTKTNITKSICSFGESIQRLTQPTRSASLANHVDKHPCVYQGAAGSGVKRMFDTTDQDSSIIKPLICLYVFARCS